MAFRRPCLFALINDWRTHSTRLIVAIEKYPKFPFPFFSFALFHFYTTQRVPYSFLTLMSHNTSIRTQKRQNRF
ncbi:Uncharacterized protein APZ42_027490 [Daphnia magna]|uniref:Uncharacterized protein n=1 Tax=Daphnia magna TaxID=35525 RepID=A0A164RM49_9CRUS|nr:Uncharacterized protein APZ42_027490 [Daphnia magna]